MLIPMRIRQPSFLSAFRNGNGMHSLTRNCLIASRGCESRSPHHVQRKMVLNARKSSLVMAGNCTVGLVAAWKRGLCCESNDKNGAQTVEGHDGGERLFDIISPDEVVEKEVENGRFVWRSPAHRTGRVGSDVDIPVIHRKELTAEEVVSALEANGVMDLKTINLKGKSTICDAMIFCTAKSVPHMRILCDVLTRALKRRALRQAPGYTGAEGYDDCHDWMLVDTHNMIIQIMDTETRDVLGYPMEKEWNELRLPEARGYGDRYKADLPSKNRGRLKRGRPARRKWDTVPDYDGEDEGYEFDVVRTLTNQEEEEAYKDALRKRVKEIKQRAEKMKSAAQRIGESAEQVVLDSKTGKKGGSN